MPFFGIPIRNGLPIGLGSSAGINAWSPGYASLDLTFAGATTLDPRVTFSRTSNATLTDSNGRVSYAPHNLLTNSEDFEASAWSKSNASVTANTAVAPDGATTADKLVENTANSTHRINSGTVTVSSNATVTFSVYLKAAERTWCRIADGGVTNGGAFVDLATGQFGTISSGVIQSSIQSVGNGWYRVSITGVLAGTLSP